MPYDHVNKCYVPPPSSGQCVPPSDAESEKRQTANAWKFIELLKRLLPSSKKTTDNDRRE